VLVSERTVIVKGKPGIKPLDEGSVLCATAGGTAMAAEEDLEPTAAAAVANKFVLGRVYEVFGPVAVPHYVIKLTSVQTAMLNHLSPGQRVHSVTALSQYLRPETLLSRGCDASNVHDEEPKPDEIEYSDDEEEREARARYKLKKKRQAAAEKGEPMPPSPPAGGRGRGGRGAGSGDGGGRGGRSNGHANGFGNGYPPQQQQQQQYKQPYEDNMPQWARGPMHAPQQQQQQQVPHYYPPPPQVYAPAYYQQQQQQQQQPRYGDWIGLPGPGYGVPVFQQFAVAPPPFNPPMPPAHAQQQQQQQGAPVPAPTPTVALGSTPYHHFGLVPPERK
jgi:H/ACA ribonucleoprotein complex non-core subunit NAF1